MSGQFCYFIPPETQKNHKFSAGPKWEYWPESVFSVFIPNFDWGSIVLVFDAILRPAFLGTDSILLIFSANLRFFLIVTFFTGMKSEGFPLATTPLLSLFLLLVLTTSGWKPILNFCACFFFELPVFVSFLLLNCRIPKLCSNVANWPKKNYAFITIFMIFKLNLDG